MYAARVFGGYHGSQLTFSRRGGTSPSFSPALCRSVNYIVDDETSDDRVIAARIPRRTCRAMASDNRRARAFTLCCDDINIGEPLKSDSLFRRYFLDITFFLCCFTTALRWDGDCIITLDNYRGTPIYCTGFPRLSGARPKARSDIRNSIILSVFTKDKEAAICPVELFSITPRSYRLLAHARNFFNYFTRPSAQKSSSMFEALAKSSCTYRTCAYNKIRILLYVIYRDALVFAVSLRTGCCLNKSESATS